MSVTLLDSEINERFAFIGCDEMDQQNASQIWPLIEGEIEGVLRDFYSKVAKTSEAPHIDIDRLPFLITAQKLHWRQMLLDCHSDSYINSVRRVGATHYRYQIEPRWYIAGYMTITNKLIQIISDKLTGDTAFLADLVCTLNRHVGIDMEIALTVYHAALFDGSDIAVV